MYIDGERFIKNIDSTNSKGSSSSFKYKQFNYYQNREDLHKYIYFLIINKKQLNLIKNISKQK